MGVSGTGAKAGAHPLNRIVRNTNARKTDPINFFMALTPVWCVILNTRFENASEEQIASLVNTK
jgi:hypothetical protein